MLLALLKDSIASLQQVEKDACEKNGEKSPLYLGFRPTSEGKQEIEVYAYHELIEDKSFIV